MHQLQQIGTGCQVMRIKGPAMIPGGQTTIYQHSYLFSREIIHAQMGGPFFITRAVIAVLVCILTSV